ncbi:hypothetical protein PVK06_020153 [Gossypium arboreum]|uniref:Uncharacterized protein n=1 Tax=Gossypium arboreum TaxID=29729 RepID=A0ABR0PM95_GOSAR|nr:hypothetical protein PVK06_020153 [Gossypium arboreum]
MHVGGITLDLNWFLQFIFTLFIFAFVALRLRKNTASKCFEVDANFDRDQPMPSIPMDIDHFPCAVCSNPASKKCSRCKSVRYWYVRFFFLQKNSLSLYDPPQPANVWTGRMGIRQSAKKFQHKLQPQPFSVVAPVPVNGTSKILKKSRKMSAESSKTHGGLRAVYCSYGCSKYKQQDGNGNLNELKGHIKMLLIENRELRIENAEFKKMVKVDEIEKLVRKVAKQKEIKRV